jgi:hypothetical protein
MSDGSRRVAIGIAVSRRCDLLVAVAQGKSEVPQLRRVTLEFLEAGKMAKWMTAALNGR